MTTDTPAPPGRAEIVAAVLPVFAEVLDAPDLTPDSDFFVHGGNSLLAIRVAGRVGRRLGRQVPPAGVLKHPTPDLLAAHLEEEFRGGGAPPIPAPRAGAEADRRPSTAQERVWLLHQLDPDRLDHLVTVALDVDGTVDPAAFTAAWTAVVRRHEALRSRFVKADDDRVAVVVDAEAAPEISVLDLARFPAPVRDRLADERVRLLRTTPVRLDTGPLARFALLRLADRRYRIELAVHHIVCDGWSLDTLLADFLDAYGRALAGRSPALPPPAVSFADYVAWERDVESSRWPDMAVRLARRFADRPADLPLPVDPVAVPAHEDGDDVTVHAPPGLAAAVERARTSFGHTALTFHLTALGVLLARITGVDDLVVAVPVAGRAQTEHEDLVGLFVNTALARVRLGGTSDVRVLLDRNRDEVDELVDCQTFPFDRLVDLLGARRTGTRVPLARVSLAVQNFDDPGTPAPELGFTWQFRDPPERQSKFDLAFTVSDTDGLRLTVTYRPSLFRRATVAAWAGQYLVALEHVVRGVADPEGSGR